MATRKETNLGPVRQALVQALRAITALNTAVSNEFHERIARTGVGYPHVIYDIIVASRSRTFDGPVVIATVDIHVVSDDQVEASNLDQLVLDGLNDSALVFTGVTGLAAQDRPTTLNVLRLLDLTDVSLDDAANKVYASGGRYQLWMDQSR